MSELNVTANYQPEAAPLPDMEQQLGSTTCLTRPYSAFWRMVLAAVVCLSVALTACGVSPAAPTPEWEVQVAHIQPTSTATVAPQTEEIGQPTDSVNVVPVELARNDVLEPVAEAVQEAPPPTPPPPPPPPPPPAEAVPVNQDYFYPPVAEFGPTVDPSIGPNGFYGVEGNDANYWQPGVVHAAQDSVPIDKEDESRDHMVHATVSGEVISIALREHGTAMVVEHIIEQEMTIDGQEYHVGDSLFTSYLHLAPEVVNNFAVGQHIERGQELGQLADPGKLRTDGQPETTFGYHLHLATNYVPKEGPVVIVDNAGQYIYVGEAETLHDFLADKFKVEPAWMPQGNGPPPVGDFTDLAEYHERLFSRNPATFLQSGIQLNSPQSSLEQPVTEVPGIPSNEVAAVSMELVGPVLGPELRQGFSRS